MRSRIPLTQRWARATTLAWLTVVALLAGCANEPFVWYEEAQQDDGSIVIVKTSETRSSQTRVAPGAGMTGYRFIQIEFDNPVTGQHMWWKPSGIPPLLPLALHFDRETPYVFGYPYSEGDLGRYGCPVPPYVIFKWTGRLWSRVMPVEIPRKFSRVNLLSNSAEDFFVDGKSQFVQDHMLIKAGSLDRSNQKWLNYIERYTFRLQYEDVGPLGGSCQEFKNKSTQYDHLELSNGTD